MVGANQRVVLLSGFLEFLDGVARDLGDNVIDARLEARRSFARDVVLEFVKQVADGEFSGDFRDGKARAPGALLSECT